MATKPAWLYEPGGSYYGCSSCSKPSDYHIAEDGNRGIVRLCTDCADALADVVNERRAVEKADNPADSDPERALSFEEADELWG